MDFKFVVSGLRYFVGMLVIFVVSSFLGIQWAMGVFDGDGNRQLDYWAIVLSFLVTGLFGVVLFMGWVWLSKRFGWNVWADMG